MKNHLSTQPDQTDLRQDPPADTTNPGRWALCGSEGIAILPNLSENHIIMKMFVCPIHWTRWREDFEPDCMVSLVDCPEDLEELRPPWIAELAHYTDCFLDLEDSGVRGAPSRCQIENLVLWLQRRVSEEAQFLIHCHAGRGRSPAAGYIAWALLLGPGREGEAFECMVRSCKETELLPNRLVVSLADEILGREGRLAAPLHDWNSSVPWSRTYQC